MKKELLFYGGLLLTAAALLSAAYYISYKRTMEYYENQKSSASEMTQENSEKEDIVQEPSVQVDTVEEALVGNKTRYVVETCDREKGTVLQEALPLPAALIGLNREETAAYLSDYMRQLPIEEYLQGLMGFDLVSFSNKQVVVRKTYDGSRVLYKYYLCMEKQEIMVYYSDRTTLYEATGMDAVHLPAEERIKLAKGIFVKDDEELYGILENYSS